MQSIPQKGFSFLCVLVAIPKFQDLDSGIITAESIYIEVDHFIIQSALPFCGCDSPVEGSQEPIVAILGEI